MCLKYKSTDNDLTLSTDYGLTVRIPFVKAPGATIYNQCLD